MSVISWTLLVINRQAIDLYQDDAVLDFKAVYASGIRLVIHKASEGATWRDAKYADRRKAATAAGLMWAAYHFGRGGDVSAQVANFLSAADPDDTTRLILDWEVTDMSTDAARTFLSAIDAETGRPTILYSYQSFLRDQFEATADPFFGAHPLWLAAYTVKPPVPQASWSKFLLWQYTDGVSGPEPHAVPGTSGEIDCNHFEGTAADLKAAWLADATRPVTPTPDPWDLPAFLSAHVAQLGKPGADPMTLWAQIQLNVAGTSGPIPEDGFTGPQTSNAVRAFERARNLTVDAGLIGPQVIAALKAASAA